MGAQNFEDPSTEAFVYGQDQGRRFGLQGSLWLLHPTKESPGAMPKQAHPALRALNSKPGAASVRSETLHPTPVSHHRHDEGT